MKREHNPEPFSAERYLNCLRQKVQMKIAARHERLWRRSATRSPQFVQVFTTGAFSFSCLRVAWLKALRVCMRSVDSDVCDCQVSCLDSTSRFFSEFATDIIFISRLVVFLKQAERTEGIAAQLLDHVGCIQVWDTHHYDKSRWRFKLDPVVLS